MNFKQIQRNIVFCRICGLWLLVIEVISLSGHLSNIDWMIRLNYWSLFLGESLGPGCNITDIELSGDSTTNFRKCSQFSSTDRHCGGRPLPLGSQIKYSFQQGTTCHHRNRLPLATLRMWRKRQLQSISDSD